MRQSLRIDDGKSTEQPRDADRPAPEPAPDTPQLPHGPR